jgi:hypothetical protein
VPTEFGRSFGRQVTEGDLPDDADPDRGGPRTDAPS